MLIKSAKTIQFPQLFGVLFCFFKASFNDVARFLLLSKLIKCLFISRFYIQVKQNVDARAAGETLSPPEHILASVQNA